MDTYGMVDSRIVSCDQCGSFVDVGAIEPVDEDTHDGCLYYRKDDVDELIAELRKLLDNSLAQTDDCLSIIRSLQQ